MTRLLASALAFLAMGCPMPGNITRTDLCAVDGGALPDAGVRACDAPLVGDPDAVVDRETFRAQASALVCELSLRCADYAFASPYCHPDLSADLERRTRAASPPFDLDSARACVEGLAHAPTCSAAGDLMIQCFLGDATGFSGIGSCESGCAFGLACGTDGRCARGTTTCNGECDESYDCVSGDCDLTGHCVANGLGASFVDACALGLDLRDDGTGTFRCLPPLAIGAVCDPGNVCDRGVCDATTGTCRHVGHVGCDCTRNDECPGESAWCWQSVCVLRPLVGDPCTNPGPPCIGGLCEAGVCRIFEAGESGCTYDGDCVGGSACVDQTRCGSLVGVGGVCGGSAARCAVGTACIAGVCTNVVSSGQTCDTCTAPTCRHCLSGGCVNHLCEG